MEIFVDTAVALVLLVILCFLIGKLSREKIVEKISLGAPLTFWIVAIILMGLCATPIILKGGVDVQKLVRLTLYFLAPTLVLSLKKWRGWGDTADLFAAFLIFFPAVFRWIPAWAKTEIGPSIPIAYWGMSIYILAVFSSQNNLEVNIAWKFKLDDLKMILFVALILFVCIVPLAIHANFLVAGLNFFHNHKVWQLPFVFAGIFFTIALAEELLCRVVIQGILSRKFGWIIGTLLAALIFGLGHITRRVPNSKMIFVFPNWWYVFFATIAGIGYGYAYHKRKSLVACATLHTLVDFIWFVFFVN